MEKQGRGGKLEVFKLLQTSGCTWPYLAAFWCSPGPHLVFMNIFTVFVIWMLSQGKIQERAKETDFRSLYPEKYSFLKPKTTSPRRLEVGKQYKKKKVQVFYGHICIFKINSAMERKVWEANEKFTAIAAKFPDNQKNKSHLWQRHWVQHFGLGITGGESAMRGF